MSVPPLAKELQGTATRPAGKRAAFNPLFMPLSIHRDYDCDHSPTSILNKRKRRERRILGFRTPSFPSLPSVQLDWSRLWVAAPRRGGRILIFAFLPLISPAPVTSAAPGNDTTKAKTGVTTHEKRTIRDLEADGSIGEPTEEELKTFLKTISAPTPAELIKTFETAPGFRLELIAAEPMVRDPITAAFDEDGNLYVGEMRDYPYNANEPVKVAWQENRPKSDGRPIGSVRLLRDTDGDGRFDVSHIFADGLLWPGGIQPWKGGVFVTAPPDIWYFKDTDGDGKADILSLIHI